MVRKYILKLLLLAIFILPAGVAVADEIIKEGETISADLNISDDLQIEAGGLLNANAHILNGDANIAGTINGNLLIVGGDVDFAETAVVEGTCVLFGGDIRSNASDTTCTTAGNFDFAAPNLAVANSPNGPLAPMPPDLRANDTLSGMLFGSLVLSLVAFAAAHFVPRQINQIGDTLTAKPVMSGTVGVLTLLGGASAISLLLIFSFLLLFICIGLLGFTIALAFIMLLGLGLVMGWAAVGNIVGEILADQLHLHQLSMPLTAALGTFALSIGVGLLGLMPVIGFSGTLVWWLVAGIGLGAAALTRLGTRPYPAFRIRPDKLEQLIDL